MSRRRFRSLRNVNVDHLSPLRRLKTPGQTFSRSRSLGKPTRLDRRICDMHSKHWLGLALVALGAWGGGGVATRGRTKAPHDPSGPVTEEEGPGKKAIQPAAAPEDAPRPSARLELPPAEKLTTATKSYFEGHIGRRIYV